MTKMGQKRSPDEPRSRLAHAKPKMVIALREYSATRHKLITTLHDRSEISGKPFTECHHILGRRGKLLVNPFNMLLITRKEHVVCQEHMSHENKLALLALVIPIRISQGYRLAAYCALPFGCYKLLAEAQG